MVEDRRRFVDWHFTNFPFVICHLSFSIEVIITNDK